MKMREMIVWFTLFCFCLAMGGCGSAQYGQRPDPRDYDEVFRETKTSQSTEIFFEGPNGEKGDIGVIENAIKNGDMATLERFSWIHHPESPTVAEKLSPGTVYYSDYSAPDGTPYINIGRNPEVPGGMTDEKLPKGWLWTTLPRSPKPIKAHVRGGLGTKKKPYAYTWGALKPGEKVAVYMVTENGQPIFDAQRRIKMRVGSIQRCGNTVLNDIFIWMDFGIFQTIVRNTVMVLTKVIQNDHFHYLVKKDPWKWWLVAAGVGIGILTGAAVGKAIWDRGGTTINNNNIVNCPTCSKPTPKPPPPPPKPCPTTPYVGSMGQIVQPTPAPRPPVP